MRSDKDSDYCEASEGMSKFSQRSFSPVNWVKIWRTPHSCHPVPSAATIAALSPHSIPLLHAPRQSCYRTLAPSFSLECTSHWGRWWRRWNADVRLAGSSLTSRGWVSTCAWMQSPLGPPVISIARIPLPRYRLAPHTWRGGAIGIEKWCTPVQSHSFPRLSDPRGRRAPLSSSSRRSPILFRGCLSRLFPPFLLTTTIKTIHRTFFSLAYMYCPSIPFISSRFVEF